MSTDAANYPVSRWYLRPAAGRLAAWLTATRIRPVHLTACGLLSAAAAAVVLIGRPEMMPLAAVFVLGWWFFDRADGQLARRQNTVSAWGAWLDGNVDELADVGLHVAVGSVLAVQTAASWPWWLLVAFLGGKYLFVHGLTTEEHANGEEEPVLCEPHPRPLFLSGKAAGWLRRLYHLPGNADVRAHLLVLALATGYLAAELALVAIYYNVRWLVRYVLVARRLGGTR
ncbi:MAG TPA: CDP-alcohol phosphatidyltransferase family protein [Thermoguttaceae bacterium]|nr:CDP-alcohol phosphatidyltransferase family protein [Thermoguttaceae bacterium]